MLANEVLNEGVNRAKEGGAAGVCHDSPGIVVLLDVEGWGCHLVIN